VPYISAGILLVLIAEPGLLKLAPPPPLPPSEADSFKEPPLPPPSAFKITVPA
jgi:hypothetical protein